MNKGTVKWYDAIKGFGFIANDEGGDDIFVHTSGVIGDAKALTDGQKVTFDTAKGKRGMQAVNVSVA